MSETVLLIQNIFVCDDAVLSLRTVIWFCSDILCRADIYYTLDTGIKPDVFATWPGAFVVSGWQKVLTTRTEGQGG